MDAAMSTYLLHHYDAADAAEQQLFAEFLEEQDPDIMVWFSEPDAPNKYSTLIRKIRQTLIAGA